MHVDMGRCDIGGGGCDDDRTKAGGNKKDANRQRASLLLELQAMIRLRSPFTVNVYGAITSREDRLVLVMELLTGGDLRSFLRHTEGRLPEARARQIIQDVCTGMAFLHIKNAVHGDLKSANILLDGDGRVKVRQGVRPTNIVWLLQPEQSTPCRFQHEIEAWHIYVHTFAEP